MQRFFFNHRSKDGSHDLDIDGLELNNLNDALEEAAYAARTAIAFAAAPSSGCFEIEDGSRTLVGRVPYSGSPDMPAEAIEVAKIPILVSLR